MTQQSPVAKAAASPTTGTAPLAVNFSSAGAYDPDGSLVSYDWEFGDGGISTLANPQHSYSAAGTYTASLVVRDNAGFSDFASLTITVQQPPNVLPIASVTATPTSGVAPLNVAFSSTGSYDPDGSIASYSWSFGDGVTSTIANPSHIYASQGTYTATLTVTDNRGGKASKSRQITVQPDLSKVVTVKSIAMSLVSAPSGTIARAQVTIVRKSDGTPITSATVTGTWSGIVSGTASGISGTDGKCTVSSPKTKRRGTYTFTVTNVSASGLTYQPAQNVITSNSITN